MLPDMLDIATLRSLYARKLATPLDVVETVSARCDAYGDPAVWIARVTLPQLRETAKQLMVDGPRPDQPLWGIPFAVKDNIDCAGFETTAACPAFAYPASGDATAVARLRAAGAILIGKTNLDQFATGLNGTRSPYGAPRSVFNPDYISGGSSSGSAVAVAAGLVSFALGTDTAGSGRVPAAFNNIVGIKPTKGLVSTHGLVPACRSLDCISVFALTAGDGDLVRRLAQGLDPDDPYSRSDMPRLLPRSGLRIGILGEADRTFFGNREAASLYDGAIAALRELGAVTVEIDYAPFKRTAELLYQGPWVAERLAGIEAFMAAHADAMDPTVRTIIALARDMTAVETFRAQYRLQELQRVTGALWAGMDVMLLPTAPTTYTVAAMQADPVRLNSRLGEYTNFVNLLDYAAVAIPAGFGSDGLPFGVTLIAPAFHDGALAALADRLHRHRPSGLGGNRDGLLPEASRIEDSAEPAGRVSLFVVGAHLSGMPLNHELTARNGVLLRSCRTSPNYQLYALAVTDPAKPGLIRTAEAQAHGIEGEVWSLDAAAFGSFVAAIPTPLGIAKILLEDGTQVSGFVCEPHGLAGARDITAYGGWRRYKSGGRTEAPAADQ
jgi:allophanate hydrolase